MQEVWVVGFVEAGGAYLGLCAGSYYACAEIEFELGTKCVSPSLPKHQLL